MINIRNGKAIVFNNEVMWLIYSHINNPCWKILSEDPKYIRFGFEKEGDFYVKKLMVDENYDYSAYEVSTYCNYKNCLYYFENIWNGIVILSPELETKKKLGLHIYDDRRIEIDYNKFINNVEDIWEERTPIEGFKFDVEPIHYIKKDGKYLE